MPIQTQESDIKILQVLADYRILSAKRTAYVLERNVRALQRRLGTLVTEKLVVETALTALKSGPGRPESAYSLTHAGFKFLVKRGILQESQGHQMTTAEALSTQLLHQDMVNSARISLLQLDRNAEQFRIDGISSNSPLAFEPSSSHPKTCARVNLGSQGQSHKKLFIPDFVFQVCDRVSEKSLLFFLEADTGSEHLTSSNTNASTISGKVACYQEYFRSDGYKQYETIWNQNFTGFRLLFLCSEKRRAASLSRLVRSAEPSDFIWVTSLEDIVSDGLSGNIWYRGGRRNAYPESILGKLAIQIPLEL